jgi:voltage-gated potassium channel
MSAVDAFANVPLFSELDDDELNELAKWFHVQNVAAGKRLVGEGAHGYTFFILLEGSAVVTLDGQSLATLAPGDFFGEIAILGDGRRTATVTSTAQCRLLAMFGTEFRQLEVAYPRIAARIAEAMQTRLAGHIADRA